MCTLLWFVCAMPVVAAMAWGMRYWWIRHTA
jgi:hypothetical protein